MKKLIKIAMAVIILGIYLISMLNFASALTIISVDTSPDEIAPGETSEIKIGIENDAEDDVEDVSVSLDLKDIPFAPYDSSSEYSIDEIRDGRMKYAEFELIALSDADSGIYKIPLEITYREKGETEERTKSSLIGITVNSLPIISAHIEEGLLLKGQENKLSIEVTNKGLSDINFLEIELQESTYYSVLGPRNIYVGNIDSDDFDSVEFTVLFKQNIPTKINFPVNLNYKDNLNNKYEDDFNLQTNVYDRKKAIELGLIERNPVPTYVGIVIAVIIIWIVYRKMKKRRKMKKANSQE